MKISLPMNDPEAEGVEEFLEKYKIVRTKLENSYDPPFEEFWFEGDLKSLIRMHLEFWGGDEIFEAFGTPYSSKNGMLEGPLNQPADLMGIADVDGFVQWVNEIFVSGMKRGAVLERELVRYDLEWLQRSDDAT